MAAPPLTLTERDRQLLAVAGELRFVLAAQLGALLGVSARGAARRLAALRRAGLVASARRLHDEPTAYWLTAAGVRTLDGDLSAPRPPELATYRHEVGVAWLMVGALRGRFGPVRAVVGERRMRSEDLRADRPPDRPLHGIRSGWDTRGGASLHYPDLVLHTASGHRVAFELELSTKTPARRERILAAYAAERRIDVVVYFVPTAAAARAIERSARAVGAEEKLRVHHVGWRGGRAPGEPPRIRRRSAVGRDAAAEVER